MSKSLSTALTTVVHDNLKINSNDLATIQAIDFIKKIISPQLPDDSILDPNDFVDFLRAQNAIQYRVGVNLYFLIYMLCYNPVMVDAELSHIDDMFQIGDKIYRWQLLRDNDGNRFAGVSEFILWLAGEIFSSRATVWRKVSLIRNLLGLGLTLDEAYNIFSLGSFSVNKVMKTIGEFKEGKLVEVSPVVAEKFIKYTYENNSVFDAREIEKIWGEAQDSIKSYFHFITLVTPYIGDMVKEFSHFEEASELRQWEDSVLIDPEYTFRVRNDSLIIKATYYKYNADEDKKYVSRTAEEILIPTSRADGVLSDDIIQALAKHLPLRRRTQD